MVRIASIQCVWCIFIFKNRIADFYNTSLSFPLQLVQPNFISQNVPGSMVNAFTTPEQYNANLF